MANPNLNMTLAEFMKISSEFPIKFPIQSGRCIALKKMYPDKVLESHINNTYPVVHERVISLIKDFLEVKRRHGTDIEKETYECMETPELLNRLLTKRPMKFVGPQDRYMLRDGKKGCSGFDAIGKDHEKKPLILALYQSYDEMKLSALIGVSSPTYFINSGYRTNCGFPEEPGTFEQKGVIIGLVGSRLKKRKYMEYQDCVIDAEQNVPENGYGERPSASVHDIEMRKMWAKFYGVSHFPLHKDVHRGGNESYVELKKSQFLHVGVYKERIRVTAETLLLEANHRASKEGTKAYLHVVGLGLGLWKLSKDQESMFMDVFFDAITSLGSSLKHVSDVDFSWIFVDRCGNMKDGESFPGTEILLHISKRDPAEKLEGVHKGKLLVFCYAWDGNAFPGNEFWSGNLKGSGDSAAAACSQIAELQNAHINRNVCGRNAYVATLNRGLVSLEEHLNPN